jgi:hypothetical protein
MRLVGDEEGENLYPRSDCPTDSDVPRHIDVVIRANAMRRLTKSYEPEGAL